MCALHCVVHVHVHVGRLFHVRRTPCDVRVPMCTKRCASVCRYVCVCVCVCVCHPMYLGMCFLIPL